MAELPLTRPATRTGYDSVDGQILSLGITLHHLRRVGGSRGGGYAREISRYKYRSTDEYNYSRVCWWYHVLLTALVVV